MKSRLLPLALLSCVTVQGSSLADMLPRYRVLIPRVELRERQVPGMEKRQRERIVGIKVKVRGGAIASLPKIPVGWGVTIRNDASWSSSLSASVTVAAAALDPHELRRDFVVVVCDAPAGLKREAEDLKVHVELALSADFEHLRHINLGPDDLVLEKESCDCPDPHPHPH